MSTSSTSRVERFIVVEEPYWSSQGIHRRGGLGGLAVGDIVEADTATDEAIDSDGDRAIIYEGLDLRVANDVLVSLDALIKSREDRAEPLADWERELLAGPTSHEVTLARPVIKPTKLADVLRQYGMGADQTELVVGLAVLRSVE